MQSTPIENGQSDACQDTSVTSTTNLRGKDGRRVCILILGMHRSGTSALTRVINLLGAALPTEVRGRGPGNEAGHWEPERLAALHDQMLADAGSSWDDWRAFNLADLPLSRANQYRIDISRIFAEEYGDAPLVVLKDPRICRLTSLYIEILEVMGYELKFIHIQRNPLDVEASLEKRDGFPPSFSDLLWLRHVLDAEVATRGRNRVFVRYETLMSDWRSVIDKINAALAVNLNREGDAQIQVDSFLTDEYKHHESPVEAIFANDKLSWWLKDAFQSLMKLEVEANNVDALARLDHLRADFDHASLHLGGPVLATLANREDHLVAQLNAEREAQVANLSREIAERDGQSAVLKQTVDERDETIAELGRQASNFSAEIDDLKRQLAEARVSHDALASELNCQNEDHTRLLATLKRGDYDGRLPKKLSGLRQWIPGRGRKIRQRAREYCRLAASPLFDRDWYLANNPDVAAAKLDPVYHYLRYGAREGRAPGPHFSGQAYKQANLDVADSGENPLLHFVRVGAREGRSSGYGLNATAPRSPLDAAAYREWVHQYDTVSEADRQAIAEHLARLNYQPLISVIMPAFETPEATFRLAIESVRAQLYANWELCVADDASPSPGVSAVLAEYSALDDRIKWMRRQEYGQIAAASNSALELASGEFVALMNQDDVIPPHALYEVVVELNAHPQVDIIYSDEDKIDEAGRRFEPHFKTDWNPELFLQYNLVNHLGVYRRTLVAAVGGFRIGFEGSQDYDLALRCVRATSAEKIRHIPAILYHWRRTSQDLAFSERHLERCMAAARKAKAEYFATTDNTSEIAGHPQIPCWERVVRPVPQPAPLVSIIVATRNHGELLGPCLNGLMNKTSYHPIEIIIVDHESDEPQALAVLKRVSGDPRIRIMGYKGPFNFSAMNNRAVELARGELIAFVNDAIEVIAPDWLAEMVALAARPEAGAVGAKLLYPDGRVRTAGVGLGFSGVAADLYRGAAADQAGYFGRLLLVSNVSAVTAACLVVRKAVYREVGGLNETDLRVAFNDLDFCLKLREKGYRNVWTPFATLYQHESQSRGPDTTPEDAARFRKECDWLIKTWGAALVEDPYFSPNLSLDGVTFELAFPPRRVKPWLATAAVAARKEAEHSAQREKFDVPNIVGADRREPMNCGVAHARQAYPVGGLFFRETPATAERQAQVANDPSQEIAERDGQAAALKQTVRLGAVTAQGRSWAPRAVSGRSPVAIRLLAASRHPLNREKRKRYRNERLSTITTQERSRGRKPLSIRLAAAWRHPFNRDKRRRFRNDRLMEPINLSGGFLARGADTKSKAQLEYELFDVVPFYLAPKTDIPLNVQGKRLAVHLHLYYDDMLEACVSSLKNIDVTFDLFVSINEGKSAERYRAIFSSNLPRVRTVEIRTVPNRGRNIAPLIVTFGRKLCTYDYIAHFHTKKSPHIPNGDVWFGDITHAMFGSPSVVHQIIALLLGGAKVVYPAGNLVKDNDTGWSDNRKIAETLLSKYSRLSIAEFPIVEFPQGAMFWARAASLKEFLSLPLSYSDFDKEPISADGTIAHALERLVLVFAKGQKGLNYRIETPALSAGHQIHHEAQFDFSNRIVHKDIKVLAYYLPQFHPIPENDAWHGSGFTEWTKVTSAKPLFADHYQQRIPHDDIGYYNIYGSDMLVKQSIMMKKAGIFGLIFYHYWFSGRMILDEPAKHLLSDSSIDMPYCFCWANENWTRKWDGNEAEILLKQIYSLEDARAFIRYLIPFFKDPRYISVNGRPVLYVYRPTSMENPRGYLEVWREECEKENLAAPFVVATLTRGASSPEEFGMDAAVERVLHDWTAGAVPELKNSLTTYGPIDGSVLDYNSVADHYMSKPANEDFTLFRSLVPAWDNTARYGADAFLLHNFSTQKMQQWVERLFKDANARLASDRRFVVVNAWNEWAEGAHLEPDFRYGYGCLNAMGRALSAQDFRANSDLFPGCQRRLTIAISGPVRDALIADPSLSRKFTTALAKAIVQGQYLVKSCDALVTAAIEKLGVQISSSDSDLSDFCLFFHAPVIFSKSALDLLVNTASRFDEVRVLSSVANAPSFTELSGRFGRALGAEVFKNTSGRKSDSIVQWAAPSFQLLRSTKGLAEARSDKVSTVVRFHKGADEALLWNALYSLAAQTHCCVQPWVALQDVEDHWCSAFEALLRELPWGPDCAPVIRRYATSGDITDLRAVMLNEVLKEIGRGLVAFLDYDDVLYPDAYCGMVSRIKQTNKNATFGRVYTAYLDHSTKTIISRRKVYIKGASYADLLHAAFIPLHSVILDLDKIDVQKISYFADMKYMEDYYLLLQVLDERLTDWESLGEFRFIGDYIYRVGGANTNTLAVCAEEDLDRVLNSDEYQRSLYRIEELKRSLRSNGVDRTPPVRHAD